MITEEIKTYYARFVRKLILRGRAAVGYYSLEGYATAPNEPQQAPTAKRAQHYGFTSEPPDGAEVIALAINGGATNRVAVAETVVGEPEIENKEVLLWSEFGQRVLLDKNLQIRLDNGNGATVVMNGAATNITQDAAIARDLQVNRDTKVDHLVGGTDAVLTCTPSGGVTATALGSDLAFDVTFTVPNSVTVAPGTKIATITLQRTFDLGARLIASPKSGSYGVAASFGAVLFTASAVDLYWYGQALSGPLANLVCTVAIFGKR